MDFQDFHSDSKTTDAVIRNLIVIGEAARHIPPEVVPAHPEIPWRLMRDMRNFAVHEYWGVELQTVWETIQKDLPPLMNDLAAIVAKNGDGATSRVIET